MAEVTITTEAANERAKNGPALQTSPSHFFHSHSPFLSPLPHNILPLPIPQNVGLPFPFLLNPPPQPLNSKSLSNPNLPAQQLNVLAPTKAKTCLRNRSATSDSTEYDDDTKTESTTHSTSDDGAKQAAVPCSAHTGINPNVKLKPLGKYAENGHHDDPKKKKKRGLLGRAASKMKKRISQKNRFIEKNDGSGPRLLR